MTAYLDNAATTKVSRAAARAALQTMTEGFGNPSARYPLGGQAAKRLKADRETVAKALGCDSRELIFTSCGTEGDNWAIQATWDAISSPPLSSTRPFWSPASVWSSRAMR